MAKLLDILPPPEVVLSLQPEELAAYVMEHIHSMTPGELKFLNRNNFCAGLFYNIHFSPPAYQKLAEGVDEQITQAVAEAWFWLEKEGFLVPKPGPNRDAFFVSRRGQRVKNAVDLEAVRKADLLPKRLLYPVIAEKIWALFLRGEYETAVFQAFKEVEVATRQSGGFASTDIGVDLMRDAFNPTHGPLRDKDRPKAEQEALFAGAIGLYKNPTSHRTVDHQAEETIELLMLASHLLRIIDTKNPEQVR